MVFMEKPEESLLIDFDFDGDGTCVYPCGYKTMLVDGDRVGGKPCFGKALQTVEGQIIEIDLVSKEEGGSSI
jgi:hypothetical protein